MELLRARTTRSTSEGWEIGAIYHSHVRSEPYPSQTDIGFAAGWPGVEWIIVGLAGGERAGGALLSDRRRRGRVEVDARGRARELSDKPLICPACGSTHPRTERFCPDCEMPLVHMPGQRARSERAPAQGAQDQAAVRRRTPRQGRHANNQPECRADRGAAARGGHPEHVAPLGRLRRARLPRRGPARRARARVRRRSGARSARAAGADRDRGSAGRNSAHRTGSNGGGAGRAGG